MQNEYLPLAIHVARLHGATGATVERRDPNRDYIVARDYHGISYASVRRLLAYVEAHGRNIVQWSHRPGWTATPPLH